MAIKVHGTAMSPAVMRVLSCLYEKGLEFELVPVNMSAGEHKSPSFLSLNPFGQVPAFEDGDLKLFESRAISQYIAYSHADKGTKLVNAEEPKKMAITSVWMEVEAQKFDVAASKLVWELAIKPFFKMEADEAAVAENEEKLGKVLDVYEARLGESKYLAGDCFSLADLHHQPAVHYLMGTKAKAVFESRPCVSAWCADILARPAWCKVAETK